jgi:Domain of unknown function (DUF4856)
MTKIIKFGVCCAFFALFLTACDDRNIKPLPIPDVYDGSLFANHTTAETSIRLQLEALVTEIKRGRATNTILSGKTLSDLYNVGNPSLKSITTPYYVSRIEGAGNWLEELANASGTLYAPGAPAGKGGTFGGYLFEENGLELEQMVEKGLFGAALYHQATVLMQGEITPATVDRLVHLYGAHPDFPNTPTAGKATNPDKFMAGYAARRDKNDGKGLYSQVKQAFIKLQAAVKAEDDYAVERDEALATIRTTWEKANAATVINYCHSVVATMSATAPTDNDKAKSLHAYGECVGFLHGWRTIPQGYKALSDAEIDELLVLLNAPYNGTPTSYKFATAPVNELPKLLQVIDKLKAKFGFTAQEVEDFKKNWVSEQGR